MRTGRRLLPLLLAVAAAAPWQAAAAQQQKPTVVILVRHAEKDRTDPTAPDPGLTPGGEQRALDLARAIRRRNVDAIVTTHLRRTALTARPTATSRRITPDVFQAVGDGKQTGAGMAQLIRARHMGKTVLVVGHSNTLNATIEALGGPKLNDVCDSSSSNLFMLVLYPNRPLRFTHTHYGQADPPGGPACENGLVR
ncbi:MAG TPA: histidine phosphatase family protein [Longimicrobium sp.]|nr:histidine phosphatase family protein [Longimicrobium sp.]